MRAGAITIALFLAAAGIEAGSHPAHASFSRRHMHRHHKKDLDQLDKRGGGQCQFPSDAGLVAVTPGAKNAGWAMSPDKPCKPGMYCPYACPPGMLMAQWDPDATEYKYPQSMNGGLYCNKNGEIEKPFPDRPYCTQGAGTVESRSTCGKAVAFCQTVLPGDEDMLIPTSVDSNAVLAVPDPSYWASTAAHYFINPPGVSTKDACIWGTKKKPHGNWSPYVAGANQDKKGDTFVTLGWNPIYLEAETPFRNEMPDFGVRIKCDGECTGLPCEINPEKHSVNEVTKPESSGKAPGAGGAHFCVVNVRKGGKAIIEVFRPGGGSSSSSESSSSGSSSGNLDTSGDRKKEVVQSPSVPVTPSKPSSKSSSSSSSSSSSFKPMENEMAGGNVDDTAAVKKPQSNSSDDGDEDTEMSAAEAAMRRVSAGNKNSGNETPESEGKDKGTAVEDAPPAEPEPKPKSSAASSSAKSLSALTVAAVAVMAAVLT